MAESSTANKIGVTTATIIGMNAMIGAGIFTAPAVMATNVGPAGILAFIMVVISIWFMAGSIARLAYLFPEEGSFYLYAKQWSGHIGGMITVSAYFIGLLIALGLLCRLSGIYLQSFFPQTTPNTLGLIALFTLVALNMFGVKMSEVGQQILIVCTVLPLIITTIMCFSKAAWNNLLPFAPYGFTNAIKATRVVIFSFFGFECATSLFSIVKDPAKNVPRALTYSIILVGIIYTAFISSIIVSTPLSAFADPNIRISEILLQLFPTFTWIAKFIDFSILAAILGTVHSMIWASSSLLNIIVRRMQNSYARSLVQSGYVNTATTVLCVGSAILLSYTTLHNINLFFYLTALFIVCSFVMSMITLLTIKQEWKNQQNIKTVLGILTATAIFIFALEGIITELVQF
jgi:amino acid transporter